MAANGTNMSDGHAHTDDTSIANAKITANTDEVPAEAEYRSGASISISGEAPAEAECRLGASNSISDSDNCEPDKETQPAFDSLGEGADASPATYPDEHTLDDLLTRVHGPEFSVGCCILSKIGHTLRPRLMGRFGEVPSTWDVNLEERT